MKRGNKDNPEPLSVYKFENLTATEGMVRLRSKAKGKKSGEITSMPDFYHDAQEWRHIDRAFDRENDRYREIIKGPDGKIVRQVDELLSKHIGRGTAKKKKH
jgi:hypothetical protein